MGMMINRRRVMGGKALPYDAEIEYLESTGTQYIDTQFKHNQDTRFECDIMYNRTDNWQYPFGSVGSTYKWKAMLSPEIEDRRLGSYYKGALKYSNITVNTNNKYHYDLNKNLHTINDYTSIFTYSEFTSIYNDILFGMSNYTGGIHCARVKIFYFKLYDNSVLIRDFIPVRVGNVGYMYDKVSGQLFGNNGTGAFILGPDK